MDTEKPDRHVELTVVIPVYNEADNLPLLMQELEHALPGLNKTFEIIFIDDGSTDGSANKLRELRQNNPHVIIATQRRNFGKSAALQVGFALAQGEVIVTMDADLQDDPAEIQKLLQGIDGGFDVVSGWRHNRKANDPLSKLIASRIANFFTRVLSGVNIKDMNSGYKAYRASVVKEVPLYSDLHRYLPVLAYYWGFKVTEVPVNHRARRYGHSKYGPSRFLRSFFDLLTVLFLGRFRYRPLHLFGGIGLVLGGLGFLISLLLAILWLAGERPIGNRPLLLLGVLLIIVGIQSFSIGLVADLVLNVNRQKENPLSTVARIQTGRENNGK